MKSNRNGKTENSMPSIIVRRATVIYAFPFNSKTADIMSVQAVCRTSCGESRPCHALSSETRSSVAPRCPTCQKAINKDKIVNDKPLQREIQSLEIFCPQKEKGCDWQGALRDAPVHAETCLFVSIECPNGCGAKFERRFAETHCKADCAKRTITCEFCKSGLRTIVGWRDELFRFNGDRLRR